MGVDHTQHDAKGLPTIDAAFPDTGAMVKQIHAKGLSAGWYLNGCKCGEHVEKPANYEGDIADLHKFDFDGVKIDGCGHQRNQTFYAQLMAESGKNYTIENCHWGDCTNSDDSSCPTQDWCPFNCETPPFPAELCAGQHQLWWWWVPRVPVVRRHQRGLGVVDAQPAEHEKVSGLRRAPLAARLLGVP